MLKIKSAPKVFLQIQHIDCYHTGDPYIITLKDLARHGKRNRHVEIDHVKIDYKT